MRLNLIAACLLVSVALISCSDDNDDNQSRTELLTAKTWVYNEYYTGYTSGSSFLQYKKGASNNTLDLSGDWIKFNGDGTYSRHDYLGNTKTGTWEWLANETSVRTTEDGQSRESKTIAITADKYEWHDTTYGTYGIMIHQ